jgi:hypothetical protein
MHLLGCFEKKFQAASCRLKTSRYGIPNLQPATCNIRRYFVGYGGGAGIFTGAVFISCSITSMALFS